LNNCAPTNACLNTGDLSLGVDAEALHAAGVDAQATLERETEVVTGGLHADAQVVFAGYVDGGDHIVLVLDEYDDVGRWLVEQCVSGACCVVPFVFRCIDTSRQCNAQLFDCDIVSANELL